MDTVGVGRSLATTYSHDNDGTTVGDALVQRVFCISARRLRTVSWISSAAVSLISTKVILIDLNFHYPTYLLFLQLASATALWFIHFSWWTCASAFSSTIVLDEIVHRICLRQPMKTLPILLAALCMALSMVCFMQAVLHFPNLPVLLMFSSIVILFPTSTKANEPSPMYSGVSSLDTLLSICASFIILYEEYKLSVKGLIFVGGALCLCLSAMTLVRRTNVVKLQPAISAASGDIAAFLCPSAFVVGVIISGVSSIALESAEEAKPFRIDYLPVIVLNLIASAVVLVLGSLAFETIIPNQEGVEGVTRLEGRASMLGVPLVGLIGVLDWRFAIPSCTSIWQIAAYLALSFYRSGDLFTHSRKHVDSLPFASDIAYGTPNSAPEEHLALLNIEQQAEPSHVYPQQAPIPIPERTDDYHLERWISTLFFIVISVTWILFTMFSTTCSLPARLRPVEHPAYLDTTFNPPSTLDIIVSMYKEPPELVRNLKQDLLTIPLIAESHPKLILYTKDPSANVSLLQRKIGADSITRRPNVGREGETYLHHIITEWDRLATHTIFLQAAVHNPLEMRRRTENYFTPETGMLSLGFTGQTCSCANCGDRWGWQEDEDVIQDIYRSVFNESCHWRVSLTYKGQFIASARRIRGVEKRVYEGLRNAMVEPGSWAHGSGYLGGREDALEAPRLGFTLERMWGVVMRCEGLGVAVRCPTLVRGWRRGGGLRDCQCLDGVEG